MGFLFDQFLGIAKGSPDIFDGHIVFMGDLVEGHARRQPAEDASHRYARAANHRFAVLDFRINSNFSIHSIYQRNIYNPTV